MPNSASEVIAELEAISQRDPCGRGIAPLCRVGELERAARALWTTKAYVVILTGFPCNMAHKVPTETDGPPGAVAIARAVAAAGGRAVLGTDRCNAAVVHAAVDHARALAGAMEGRVDVESFEPGHGVEKLRMEQLAAKASHVVAIERAGRAADGKYYTMRAADMTPLIAPLDAVMELADAAGTPTTGIGDGGNELGMGGAVEAVRASVPRGDVIACTVAASHLLACGVSNWGGHALAAALCALACEEGRFASGEEAVAALMAPAEEEAAVLRAVCAAGAVDGVTKSTDLHVDSLPFQHHASVIEEMREAVSRGFPAPA